MIWLNFSFILFYLKGWSVEIQLFNMFLTIIYSPKLDYQWNYVKTEQVEGKQISELIIFLSTMLTSMSKHFGM